MSSLCCNALQSYKDFSSKFSITIGSSMSSFSFEGSHAIWSTKGTEISGQHEQEGANIWVCIIASILSESIFSSFESSSNWVAFFNRKSISSIACSYLLSESNLSLFSLLSVSASTWVVPFLYFKSKSNMDKELNQRWLVASSFAFFII